MAADELRLCHRHGSTSFVRRADGGARCRRCAVENVTRRRRERRSRLIALAGERCVSCGYDDCVEALQFHHRDPASKTIALSMTMMGRRWDALVAEVAKCDLLCANCHAIEEAERAADAYRLLSDRPGEGARRCERHGWQPHHHDGRRWRCSTCRSERVIGWYRRRKAHLVFRLGGRCAYCELDSPLAVLQFHHRHPADKIFVLSGAGLYRPLAEVLAEAEKCTLLCANCHAQTEAEGRLSSRGGG